MPKARCWLDLAPLSPRTALRTNPLSDLDGSTELAEPPLAGMKRLPRTIRRRLETVNGARCALKAVGSAPAYPLPCRTLTLLVPSPRVRLSGMGEEIWTHAATWCSWPRPGGGTHRRGERNRARFCWPRAHMHHVVTTATLACRYARGSHLQGHMERVGRALTLTQDQEKASN